MGWSFEARGFVKPNEVKGIVDSMVNGVLKSVMVGSVYYAAVEQNGQVTGLVVKTSVRNSEYCNFGTKFIHESEGPCERECPESILRLLTPIKENDCWAKWASEWREKCHKYNLRKSELSKLPFGSVVLCEEHEYKKTKWKNRTKWIDGKRWTYLSEPQIARFGFEIVR